MKRKPESDHAEGSRKETKTDQTSTSKKVQQKIEKRNALIKFKLENATNDDDKRCPSCSLTTHARSTSSLCPNKKAKELTCEVDEKVEQFVIKTSLKNICKSTTFIQNVAHVVEYSNKIIYIGSILINFIFLKMIADDIPEPIFQQNLFASISALITGNGKKAPEYIVEYFNNFCELTTLDLQQFKSIGYSSVLNIAAKQYETLIRNYIHDTHERRSITYFLSVLSDKNGNYYCQRLSVSSRKALAYYVYHKKQDLNPSWLSSVADTSKNKEIVERLLTLWSIYQEDTCGSSILYAKPYLFLKWFYYLSQEAQKRIYITENVPTKAASKAFVYRKLKEIKFTTDLNRKQFKSLQEQVLQSINAEKTFKPGKKLSKLTSPQISVLKIFIDSVKARIKDGTFSPTKYTDPRGHRLFSIAPIYSIQQKAVQLDAQAFWRLVKESNVPTYKTGKKTESDLTDMYFTLFDFRKLGFRKRESLSTGKKKFSNVITTDGYSICFLFSRNVKKKTTKNHTEKKPADFLKDIKEGHQVWGIDPGVRDIITAIDKSGRQRTISLDDYYHHCGYNDANNIRNRYKKKHMDEHLKITALNSLKTTNIEDFLKAFKERIDLYAEIKSYYDHNNWSAKLKFKCYMRKQKCLEEFCKQLTHGSIKYGKDALTGIKKEKKKNKYYPPPPIDTNKPVKMIIALGDAVFSGNLKGKRAAPVRLITKTLQRQCGDSLQICMIDEYYTSKVCSKCKKREMENIITSNSKRRVHSVLKCTNHFCNTVWNRDINAAMNILDIFKFASKNKNERPAAFKRPEVET